MVSQFAIKANYCMAPLNFESGGTYLVIGSKLTIANDLFQIQQCHEFKRTELTAM